MARKRRCTPKEVLDLLWEIGDETSNPDIKLFRVIDLEIKAQIPTRSSYRYLHYSEISPFIERTDDERWIISRRRLHDVWIEPIGLITPG